MESENMFINELNASSEQFQNCFFNQSWDNSMDQNDPFESALSSMVSSPVNSNATAAPGIVLRELIGKLGNISNSSTNNSCYTTPLNSPPKLNLSMMEHQIRANLPFPGNHLPSHSSLSPLSTDPGFADRAARYSCFANKSLGGLNDYKVSGSQINAQENKDGGSLQDGDSPENSSISQQIPAGSAGVNSRKRKSISKGKGKGKDIPSSTTTKESNVSAENAESSAKGSKSEDDDNSNEKDSKSKKNKKSSEEAPKDYIHVRARRGQATDAHSLAERVRREKIGQKMKFLQDLVPGCNKVTGKAVMLDEIINYVQSLQRQVEFLSMKLTTINPRMDVNMDALLSKDMFQSSGSLPHGTYPSDISASAFPFQFQSQQFSNFHMNAAAEIPSQVSSFWEDDLQSVVFGQNQAQNFNGGLVSTAHMKVEL